MNESLSQWIDMEHQQPPDGERVIVLIAFGLRVKDDTWSRGSWLNHEGYVSHWMPINAPGSYAEIMQRPRGPVPPKYPDESDRVKLQDKIFSDAVVEHFRLMQSIQWTQLKLRLEAGPLKPSEADQ